MKMLFLASITANTGNDGGNQSYFLQPHRVLIPEEETKKQAVRRSIAFFTHPDNNVLVECVDGSNKYPPITALEDTTRRQYSSYNY